MTNQPLQRLDSEHRQNTLAPGGPGREPERPTRRPARQQWRDLARRLHFYAAVLVGPFVLVATLSGVLYAASPTLEQVVHQRELRTTIVPGATEIPLSEQIQASRVVIGDAPVLAVRPATEPGATTRVMVADPQARESFKRAVFVDPVTAEVRGDLPVYGGTGALPVRTWIDQLHRNLHLGEPGRLYSELAASWLWIIALAGVALWLTGPRRTRRPRTRRRWSRARFVSAHRTIGLVILLGALMLSATGLTWSRLAGENVTQWRSALGWTTPKLATSLAGGAAPEVVEHHPGAGSSTGSGTGQNAMELNRIDHVAALAYTEDRMDSVQIEITPPTGAGQAWSVAEIGSSWPTQGDAVAVDPSRHAVTDTLRFESFPLPAKLATWGIDLHMGLLFGVWNQVALGVLGLGLVAGVVTGFTMWWKRRPTRGSSWAMGRAPAPALIENSPTWMIVVVAAIAVGVGLALPLVGIPLLGFLLVDVALRRWKRRSHGQHPLSSP